ncbi:peptidylprolyl isomerase [Thermodesulfobacteriota bacterium]
MIRQVQPGVTVRINYTAALSDGTTLADTTQDREPSTFMIGTGEPFPGLERVVIGMKEGQFRTRRIPADDAFT